MLVQFSIKNFLSFYGKNTLDMTAVNAYKEHESDLLKYSSKEKLLRIASFYGANASGKSNFGIALQTFIRIIVESFNNVTDDEETAIAKNYNPFFFIQKLENTEFEVVISDDEYEYQYGFEYNNKEIVEEWLYKKSLTTNRTSMILERSLEELSFGQSVRKECTPFQEQIPNETLALSYFNRLKMKSKVFNNVYDEILNMISTSTGEFERYNLIEEFLPDILNNEKKELLDFLKRIDTGIKDIFYEETEENKKFFTTHYDGMENGYNIDLFSESEGTLKAMAIYIVSKKAFKRNSVLFVDELDAKLHPLLLKYIIDMFNNKGNGAQLIYTTHDTTLLDKKFFRRDQIWFVQKDKLGKSEVTSLSDYKVRSDASFEKDYLAGVYGGIPMITESVE